MLIMFCDGYVCNVFVSLEFSCIVFSMGFHIHQKNQIERLFAVVFTASGHFNSIKTPWITILHIFSDKFTTKPSKHNRNLNSVYFMLENDVQYVKMMEKFFFKYILTGY